LNSYADTSFLVSLYGRDVNSRPAISLVEAHQPVFVVTPFGEMEFTSIVFAVTARPKGWTVSEARAIEENLARDLETGVWRWEEFPSETWARARELSRRHGPALGCRALDAVHVASALVLAADDFYTFDRDQAKLAQAVGLRVLGRSVL
jgi:predicted nucleic acid-binding protein